MAGLLSKIFTGKPKKVAPTKEIGFPGFNIMGGFLESNDKSADLSGTQRYTTYSELLANCSIVAAGTRHFLNLVAKSEWQVVPADDSSAAQELADYVREAMDDMRTPWHRVVRRTAMYRFMGFSIQEWTAKKRDDGKIGFLDVNPRPQWTIERWDTDPGGHVVGVVQRSPSSFEEVYLPITKLVYAVDDSITDSPEGLGLLRHIVPLANKLKRYELLEGYGYETDLRGVPIARAPLGDLNNKVLSGDMSKTGRTAHMAAVKDFTENHIRGSSNGVILDSATYRSEGDQKAPSGARKWDVELLKAGSTSYGDIANAIERINREMARVLGVEQLLLGSGSSGSHALSKDKTQSFFLMADGTLKEIQETYERDLIEPIWALNGFPDDLKPTLATEAVQYKDAETVTTALRDLATAGAPLNPSDDAVAEVFDLLGLTAPERDEEDDLSLMEPVAPKPKAEEKEVPEEDSEDDS